MATQVYIDKIETLNMQEKWGVIVGCTRKAFVKGLLGTNFSVMYDVLDDAGLPIKGSYLDSDRCNHLHLIDRNIVMTDVDSAEVTLVYGPFNDAGQGLYYDWATITSRNISGKMQATVSQKKTNLYRAGGAGAEEFIELEHTYPETGDSETDDPDYAGQTKTQRGEVDVYIPQRRFIIEGVKNTSHPWDIAENLVGCVNSKTWLGQPEHTWMCTEVSWEYRDDGYYFMTFTFEHNEDTWNPTAVFIDDRTGRPPEGLVEDAGYKYIRYHREKNFVSELGFYVIGPAQ